MGRCKKQRLCRRLNRENIYKPIGIPLREVELIEIELDEFEAMRICDAEQKSQIEAAEIMGVSRATVQRLLNSGRLKLITAILNSRAIEIRNTLINEEEK